VLQPARCVLPIRQKWRISPLWVIFFFSCNYVENAGRCRPGLHMHVVVIGYLWCASYLKNYALAIQLLHLVCWQNKHKRKAHAHDNTACINYIKNEHTSNLVTCACTCVYARARAYVLVHASVCIFARYVGHFSSPIFQTLGSDYDIHDREWYIIFA